MMPFQKITQMMENVTLLENPIPEFALKMANRFLLPAASHITSRFGVQCSNTDSVHNFATKRCAQQSQAINRI